MSRRTTAVVLSLLLTLSVLVPVAAAGSSPGVAADTTVDETTAGETRQVPTDESTDEHLEDPDEDVLGWENGYWYNESIEVDRSDGLNDSELDKVVARAMARVEEVRGLEFEEDVPVEIVSREEYRNNAGDYEYSTEDRLHQNTKWEATFMVSEEEDALQAQQRNRGATVGGFYSPTENRIVIVSENTTSPKLDEITLSQELFHALQDQKWDLLNYFGNTTEANNAYNGIVEGDGNYVDYLYEQRCNAEWDCLLPPENPGGGGGADINFGLYFVSFQPYSSGPGFVQELHQEGGWAAVNQVYENPPASSEQVIHPDKYGEDEPTAVTVEHDPQNGWEVLEMGEGSVNYAEFGEGGIAAMVYYPTFEATQKNQQRTRVTVPYDAFFNTDASGEIRDINPYNYDFEASAGWDGDRLYPYVNEGSAETNETGYVWKLEWDSAEDAEEFVSTYETILGYHGAERVDGLANTWRIPDEEAYGDAFHVQQEGSTVVIVNAPTQDDLQDIRPSIEFEEAETTTTDPGTTASDPGTTVSGTTAPSDATTEGDDEDGGAPGMGVLAAVAALALLSLGVRRRRR